MKKVQTYWMIMILLAGFCKMGWSQPGEPDPDELYSRAHIAFSGFALLGLNEQAYTRVIKSENYLEPERRHRKLLLNGEEFLDDGQGNDLTANDGILTSVNVYPYQKGEEKIPVGQYRIKNRLLLSDETFHHSKAVSLEKIIIKCKFIWVSCQSWPPDYRELCRRLAWPFNGFFEVKECEVTVEW